MKKKTIIIVGLLVLIILFGLINKVSDSKGEVISQNSESINKLLKNIDMPLFSKYYSYYYDNNKVDVDSFNDDMFILLGINKIINEGEEIPNSISKDRLKASINSIFGDVKYSDQSISLGKCFGQRAKYSKGVYTIGGKSCDDLYVPHFVTRVNNAIKYSDHIEIERKVIYVVYNYKNMKKPIQIVYKDAAKKKKIAKIKSDDEHIVEKSDRYIRKGYTYKYTFRKVGNNYYFDSIEKE